MNKEIFYKKVKIGNKFVNFNKKPVDIGPFDVSSFTMTSEDMRKHADLMDKLKIEWIGFDEYDSIRAYRLQTNEEVYKEIEIAKDKQMKKDAIEYQYFMDLKKKYEKVMPTADFNKLMKLSKGE